MDGPTIRIIWAARRSTIRLNGLIVCLFFKGGRGGGEEDGDTKLGDKEVGINLGGIRIKCQSGYDKNTWNEIHKGLINTFFFKKKKKRSVVAHAFNFSTHEAGPGGSL